MKVVIDLNPNPSKCVIVLQIPLKIIVKLMVVSKQGEMNHAFKSQHFHVMELKPHSL